MMESSKHNEPIGEAIEFTPEMRDEAIDLSILHTITLGQYFEQVSPEPTHTEIAEFLARHLTSIWTEFETFKAAETTKGTEAFTEATIVEEVNNEN